MPRAKVNLIDWTKPIRVYMNKSKESQKYLGKANNGMHIVTVGARMLLVDDCGYTDKDQKAGRKRRSVMNAWEKFAEGMPEQLRKGRLAKGLSVEGAVTSDQIYALLLHMASELGVTPLNDKSPAANGTVDEDQDQAF